MPSASVISVVRPPGYVDAGHLADDKTCVIAVAGRSGHATGILRRIAPTILRIENNRSAAICVGIDIGFEPAQFPGRQHFRRITPVTETPEFFFGAGRIDPARLRFRILPLYDAGGADTIRLPRVRRRYAHEQRDQPY